ncbi:MAG TPA: HAD-IB family hydrolase [Candidatus Aquilonibacter sp.]|nr:HAD-IB family hydrolase [Candidatus Aquilonibacter sp.]
MSAPQQIAAFFDLDGTLLPSPSLEWRFIAWLAAGDKIDGGHLAAWLGHFTRTAWRNPYAATFENKRYLRGLGELLAADWGSSLDADSLQFFRLGRERVLWHQARGHRVFLVSGTLAPLARAAANRLPGTVEACATELEVRDGRWTGCLAGEHLRDDAKARAIRRLAIQYDLDLAASYAYGNRLADLPMLEAVGHPVAVNPEISLERVANSEVRRHGVPASDWRVCIWKTAEPSPRQNLISAREMR